MGKGKSLITKDEMAYCYGALIFIPNFDFANYNKKIINQWSRTALIEIKRKAWKIAERLSKWEKINTEGSKGFIPNTQLKERKGR